ncbi:hypothetical protein, partial [Yersinia pestis]|uniref:hypothetical protein n=1 Tax=Yersinia pestis TaxID=632 RepID=UPI001EE77673
LPDGYDASLAQGHINAIISFLKQFIPIILQAACALARFSNPNYLGVSQRYTQPNIAVNGHFYLLFLYHR